MQALALLANAVKRQEIFRGLAGASGKRRGLVEMVDFTKQATSACVIGRGMPS